MIRCGRWIWSLNKSYAQPQAVACEFSKKIYDFILKTGRGSVTSREAYYPPAQASRRKLRLARLRPGSRRSGRLWLVVVVVVVGCGCV